MGSYTQHKYQDMIDESAEGYDIEGDFSALLDKINSNDFFEPFSERLRRYLSKHEGEDFSPDSAYLFLYNRMKEAGVNPNRNTLKNWLNVSGSPEGNNGPNWGDSGREEKQEPFRRQEPGTDLLSDRRPAATLRRGDQQGFFTKISLRHALINTKDCGLAISKPHFL